MTLVARHAGLMLRVSTCALVAFCLLRCAPLLAQQMAGGAQMGNGGIGNGIAPPPSVTGTTKSTPQSIAVIPQERVVDIRIIGNRTISRDKVLANMGTRIDRPFDQGTFERDVRKLAGKNWFVDVQPRREHVAGGIVITLEVVERPTLQYVKFLGWKKIKIHTLSKEVGLKKGDALDPYAVEEGQRKLETLYQTKGFNDVKITILEGNKATDKGAIYLISEGMTQKIWWVKFEGNQIADDAGLLRTLIQSKHPILWFFKGQVDRKKIDEDVEKVTDYYRSLGFFNAHVGRDYEFNEKEDWMTLTFYISEGPRYKVNNVSFIGNKIYDQSRLAGGLKLKAGDFYDQTKMNSDIGYIKDLYGSTGYVFANAEADLRFFLEPGQMNLIYQVSEGKQCVAGDINVHIGGDSPHTKKVTALHRSSLRPGDVIDIRKVRTFERRLKASGVFNNDPSKGDVPKVVLTPPDTEGGVMAGSSKKKKKTMAKGSGNRDSVRSQSPDDAPSVPAARQRNAQPGLNQFPSLLPSWPRSEPARSAPPVIRAQSPDNGYGGYGGQAVNPITPGGSPSYSAYQPPQSSQPEIIGAPPANQIYPPNYQPPPANAPPPGYGAQPGYAPPGGYAPPPGGYPPGTTPPLLPGPQAGPSPLLSDQPVIPIDVYVSEAQTGRFMFGAGVNSNAGLIGSIVLDEQNFDISRWPSSWEDFRNGQAFRGAGQKFRIEAAPGTQVSRYMFNFTEPYLFDTPVSFGLSGYYFQRFYRDWTEQRAGGRLSAGYQFTPDLSGNVSFRAEDIRISQPRILGVPALDAVLGYTQIYSWKTQMAHDTRDSTFLPTEGHYISGDFEYAIGTFQFPRWTVDYRQHFLLKERPDGSGRRVLSFYNNFGISGTDTPIYERFFAGGFSTLRGFQFRGASPQVNTVEVGGIFQNLSSIEYMFSLTADDMLRMVAFVDFGTVEPTVHIDWRDTRVAPGIGFRITVPAMGPAPIALDFAVPVQYAPNDIRQVFSFFVGYSR